MQDRTSPPPNQALRHPKRSPYPAPGPGVPHPDAAPALSGDGASVEALFAAPALRVEWHTLGAEDRRKLALQCAYIAGLLRPDYPDEVDAYLSGGETYRLTLPPSVDALSGCRGRAMLSRLRRLSTPTADAAPVGAGGAA